MIRGRMRACVRSGVLLLLTVVGVCGPTGVTVARAQAIDDGVMLRDGQLVVGSVYSHDSWTEYWEGPLKRENGNIGTLTTQTNTWFANYGLTDRLTILGTVPHVLSQELAQVKLAVNGLTRKQLAIVYKWADGVSTPTPPGHWNFIAYPYLATANLSEVRTARMFALLNMAMHDAAVATWDAKFAYFNPRPSQLDPGIRTVIGLPNFPSYISGHSTFSAAAAEVLSYVFPSGSAFFQAQRDEAGISRLYGGIHYQADIEVGKQVGERVAGYTIQAARVDGADD